MRLSLWQQFSSNHSDSFWVVGAFDSPESATQAAEAIRALVTRSEQWYSQAEYERRDPENLILLPELKANWVKSWEHFLFIYSHHTEYYWPAAYEPVVKQLGGQVAIHFDSVKDIGIRIICQPPDEATSELLLEAINTYFEISEKVPPRGNSDSHRVWGNIHRDDLRLVLDVEFSEIEVGLPKLVDYLRNLRCTNVIYRLRERWGYAGWEWV